MESSYSSTILGKKGFQCCDLRVMCGGLVYSAFLLCFVKNHIPSEQTGMTCQFLLNAWFVCRAKALVSCLNGWSAQSHHNVWFGCLSWTCPSGRSERWAHSDVEWRPVWFFLALNCKECPFQCRSWCPLSEDILGVIFLMYDMPLIRNKTYWLLLESTALWFQLVREQRAYISLPLTAFPSATQRYRTHKEAFVSHQLVVATILHVRTEQRHISYFRSSVNRSIPVPNDGNEV